MNIYCIHRFSLEWLTRSLCFTTVGRRQCFCTWEIEGNISYLLHIKQVLRHVTQKKNKIMSNEWITINLIKYDNTAVTWQSSLKAALTINCWTMPPLIRRWGRRNEVYSNHGAALKNVNSHFPMTAISMPTFPFSLKTNCYGQKYSVSFLVFISSLPAVTFIPNRA